jgi:hypothetical protein
VFFHQVEHQAQSGLLANARELGHFADGVFNKF